jgi:hypothetical protein
MKRPPKGGRFSFTRRLWWIRFTLLSSYLTRWPCFTVANDRGLAEGEAEVAKLRHASDDDGA